MEASFWERLLDFLLPQRCAGCGKFPRPLFCEACRERLVPVEAPFCARCGQPFPPLAHHAPMCAKCRQEPPAFEVARSAFFYEEPLRTALHRFKYSRRHGLATSLGRLLIEALEGFLQQEIPWSEVEALVPVPLHPARLRERGFNQSERLAREVGRHLGKPVATDWLHRVRNTMPQVGLTASQRQRNVQGAFRAFLPEGAQGRGLLLIDDLYTTGATVRECAKALKRAGAGGVWVLTLARAGMR